MHPDHLPVLVRRAFHDCMAAPRGPVFLSLPMDVMEGMSTAGTAEVSVIDRAAVAGSLDKLGDMLAGVTPSKLAVIAGDEILDTEGSAVPPGCRVLQLSDDVGDLGRNYATALSVVGDIKASLRVLLPMLDRKLASHQAVIASLRAAAERDRAARNAALRARAEAEYDAPVTTPLVAAEQITRAIGPRVPIIDEAIATSLHVRSFLNSSSPRQYSFLRGGGLGWGMPAAVGTSLGLGREPVVCLVGDGAAMYSPQALWTAAHEKLPVTFVVLNNREYNVLKNFMKAQPHYLSARANRFIAMDLVDPPIDFLAMAASMGVPARRVDRAADIAAAVEHGIASGGPNLIEIPITAT